MAPTKINVKDRLSEDGEIDLSMSDLQEVPVQQIVVLKKAFSLDLSNNHLVKLPKNFSTLLHISKLDLSKNAIKELPENFGELTKLTYLDLYQNKLEHLPLSFGKLKALKWLDLKDNPLVPAVSKVAGQCLDAKECQVCAKKVVAFFANLQNTVDQENAQREQSRKKQLEFNQQKNKEEKQAKKKDSKKIKEKQHLEKAVKNENNIQKKKDIKTKSNNKSVKVEPPKKATKSRSWFSVLVSLLFAIIISLFIATSISFAPLESFKNSTSLVYYQYLNKLPPNLQPYGIVLGDKIKNLHVKTGALTEHVIEFLKTNEQIHIICQSATEVVQNVTSKIVQVYTDTFPKRT